MDLGARYEDLGLIGAGGMGEVRRVRDTRLNRILAMKLLKPGRRAAGARERLLEEAQATAQLQHPSIVSVHDLGELPDGQLYFTMQEVRGETLTARIQQAWDQGRPDDQALRALIGCIRQVGLALAYAHDNGVIHRDLKPDNIMLGRFGEVLVMDWGLARWRADGRGDDSAPLVIDQHRDATRVGTVIGTPSYMAPEQARGAIEHLDARSDIYALGAILYEVLAGRRPYIAPSADAVLDQVRSGPPASLRAMAGGGFDTFDPDGVTVGAEFPPPALVATCERAMSRQPDDRHPHAMALVDELTAWLDGAARRARALELVLQAEAMTPELDEAQDLAATWWQRAEALIPSLETWMPESAKMPLWDAQDRSRAHRREARQLAARREQLLHAAIAQAPELPDAHMALAEVHLARHREAEARGDHDAAVHAEVFLAHHAEALAPDAPYRAHCARYLADEGTLTLHTAPAGARVTLHRYRLHGRRLVAEPTDLGGTTPLEGLRVPSGSYVAIVEADGHRPVRYPVRMRRDVHHTGLRPGDTGATPLVLPREGALDPVEEIYVAAGWFEAGADPARIHGALPPQTTLWCDGFVMDRYPVTFARYIAFLDALVEADSPEAAAVYLPVHAIRDGATHPLLAWDVARRSHRWIGPEGLGPYTPTWPVFGVSHHSATAWAAWRAEVTGQPWRLPWDLEWEKASRGVDGRARPWGPKPDGSYANYRDAHRGTPVPTSVTSHPIDESPFGMRCSVGNNAEWCLDAWVYQPPLADDGIVRPYRVPDPEAPRTGRGAGYGATGGVVHCAYRFGNPPSYRSMGIGFRSARSWPTSS